MYRLNFFSFSAEIEVFGLTFSVTLLSRCNLKTLLPKIIIFAKMCACARKIYQIVSLTTFHQCEVFIIKYFDK